ncbi:YciI family protein [Sulfurospirillum cavolei]|uniref:YciI family protein n=1 Tax=Sulfurospirillum cavolei TaxID=366522 RepID=UPI0007649E65|nr:YciI family protein [Sulfurospirillum cavolei]
MFIISLTYHKSLEEVDAHLSAHVEFLKKNYAQGVFLASGRKNPRNGGVILALASSKAEIEAIIARDPFYIHEIAKYDIIEFTPSMTAPEFAFLANR